MRKLSVLLMVLALALLMAAPALAGYECPLPLDLQNEVKNGDFQTADPVTGSHKYLWTPVGFPFSWFSDGPNYYVKTVSSALTAQLYQVIDERLYNGWDPNGTIKQWWFQFQYLKLDGGNAEVAVFYYNGNPASQPSFGGIDNPGAGWLSLYSATQLDQTPCGWTTVYACGTIADFQPQWIAIGFEGIGGTCGVAFDNFAFYGLCESDFIIPVPPSLVLLGSGLLTLAIFRFRKR